uniref:Uncharacterized protein n=1 Tax=Solanum tuberosum TaxID=4113 RepID=M1DEC0_SOLTU
MRRSIPDPYSAISVLYPVMHSQYLSSTDILYATSSRDVGTGPRHSDHAKIGSRSVFSNISGESSFFEDY